MFEFFRFLKCLMLAVSRDESCPTFFASLATICISLLVIFPVMHFVDRLVFSEVQETLLLQTFPALGAYPLKYLPRMVVDVLIFGPIAYSVFHSRSGEAAQNRYNRAHMPYVLNNLSALHAPVAIATIISIITITLISKQSLIAGMVALVVALAVATWVLKKYLPPLEGVE